MLQRSSYDVAACVCTPVLNDGTGSDAKGHRQKREKGGGVNEDIADTDNACGKL